MAKPLMTKATAVWLVDNTTISFKQIADFVGMHELEIQGIADGDVATGVKGFDPVTNNQLTQDEIDKAEANPLHKLKLKFNAAAAGEEKRRGPRSTPLSKRQDRPNSILWLSCRTARLPNWSAPPSQPSSRSASAPIGTFPICSRLIRLHWACVSSQSWT